VPNSLQISTELGGHYPLAQAKLTEPAWPGVDLATRSLGPSDAPAETVLFVGKEWYRKGLDIAVAVCEELRQKRPGLRLVVVGPDPKTISDIARHHWVDCRGWVENLDYSAVGRLLLHPARNEPYGMVVAEAMMSGIDVLVSSRCGVVDHYPQILRLPAEASVADWARALDAALEAGQPAVYEPWTWSQLARQTCRIYARIHCK
ncbi:MAG: glycosyltransferase, partial [Litorivicinus sp.]